MRASHAWIATYAVTGALQPLLVDRLKQRGLAPARLLGPMMANLIGMTLVAPAREACVGSPAPIAQTIRASWRPLTAAAALDFGSAALLCVGLLYAGAAAFTLVYASCAPLVSAIGAAAGAQIRREQWVAIALATLGLALYELACKSEGKAAADARLWGSLLAFLGSVGHSGMFVMAEHALENKSAKAAGLTPFRLSSCMGFAETTVLGIYVALQITYDAERMTTVAVAYAPLILIDGLHALSFFATLGERGAVSAAMLKGVQVVFVFAASSVLSCDTESGAGCATPAKAAGVAIVVAGLALFYAKEPPRLRGASASGDDGEELLPSTVT